VASSQNLGSAHEEGPLRLIDISRVARPFRLLSFGNYFLLIGGIEGLLGVLGTAFTSSFDTYTGIFLLIASAEYGFCAWVGWRNIGVLGAAVHRYTMAALLSLALFAAILSGVFGFQLANLPSMDAKGGKEAFIFLFYYAFITVVALAAAVALAVLHRVSMPGMNVTLREFLKRSLVEDSKHDPHGLPARNPRLGVILLVLGILWLFGIQMIPNDWILANQSSVQTFNYIQQIGFVFLIYARQYFQPDFKTLRAGDPRAPVLFLRSFQDDEKINYQQADGSLFDFSLESRLATHFSAIGPFIAVGEPKDKLPHLGAIRVQLSDAEWQGSVVGWMDEASLIVVMAGWTKWVSWELEGIVSRGHVGKLVLVFPQIKTRFWGKGRRQVSASGRLGNLNTAFSGTIWAAGLRKLQEVGKPERIRSIIFEPDGHVIAITSKARNRESYHLAALLAHDFIVRRQNIIGSSAHFAENAAPTPVVEGFGSMGARAFAAILDAILIATIYTLSMAHLPENLPHAVRVALAALLGLAYYWLSEGLAGATVGKAIAGIEVRRDDSKPCGMLPALIRNALRIVDAIGLYLVGFLIAHSSPGRQRLGDRLAGTLVVRKRRAGFVRVLFGTVWIAFFAFGAQKWLASAPSLSALTGGTPSMEPLPANMPVRATGNLKAGNFKYVDKQNGPPRSSVFKPGEPMNIGYQITGAKRDGNGAADLKMVLSVIDPNGLSVAEPHVLEFHEPISRAQLIQAWQGLLLPEFAPGGEYHIDAKVHDGVANSDLEFEPTFTVDAPAVGPAHGLEIRDLGVSAAEGGAPAQNVTVHPSDTIFMSCALYGLQFDKNHRKVKVALVLLGPNGSVEFEKKNYFEIDDEVFYHPATYREIITGHLSLTAEAKPGVYTEKYTLTDEIAGRSTEASVTFQME
jgi:uncharacterized RDD family membrane protein YckC